MGPVPVQMWQRRAQSRCRCGRGEPSPGADVAAVAYGPHVQRCKRLCCAAGVVQQDRRFAQRDPIQELIERCCTQLSA